MPNSSRSMFIDEPDLDAPPPVLPTDGDVTPLMPSVFDSPDLPPSMPPSLPQSVVSSQVSSPRHGAVHFNGAAFNDPNVQHGSLDLSSVRPTMFTLDDSASPPMTLAAGVGVPPLDFSKFKFASSSAAPAPAVASSSSSYKPAALSIPSNGAPVSSAPGSGTVTPTAAAAAGAKPRAKIHRRQPTK